MERINGPNDDSELTFVPGGSLARGVGHILNVGAEAKSKSGIGTWRRVWRDTAHVDKSFDVIVTDT
ncbi:MAG: hypothetical protein M0C28_44310 [Candidatus Moduliflexus flocculans]|nr:hypothetical protein [Candidatus Moduliflexus flocculans]